MTRPGSGTGPASPRGNAEAGQASATGIPGLIEALHARGDRCAISEVDSGLEVTARALAGAVTAAARERQRRRPDGGTLGLSGTNSACWLAALLGSVAGGHTVVTINPASPPDDVAAQLQRARATELLADPAVLDRLGGALGEVDVRRLALQSRETAVDDHQPLPELGDDTVITLMTSSGTTGLPKTVRQTHRAWRVSAHQFARAWELDDRDTFLAVLPFSHAAGLGVAVGALAGGARVVTMSRFDPDTFLDALSGYRITATLVVPPVLTMLWNRRDAEHHDLGALRVIGSAGAPLPEELQRSVQAQLGVPVCNAYGMTETGWVTLDTAAGPHFPGTAGPLVPEVEVRLVDPASGQDTEPGQTGELWVRGPACSPGYLDDPAATDALIDRDGWTHTGDLATLDEDSGQLRIVDRLKELIKYKGHQVAPAALEALIATRDDVTDVAVVGRTDPDAGQIPHACVVPRGTIDPDELMAWVAARVAPAQRIRSIKLVQEIPRSPSGKVLRRLVPTT